MESADRYEILSTIASGDFATVYRARDRELGREVAVKQIHQQFLGDPRQLERYWREAQLLASLQHPNILTIYDVVRPKGWLILELMRGSLQPFTQGDPIDLDYLRFVLIGSLNALNFLHANGIVHGDVKPSNLLLDPLNRIKLGDFGLARRASNEEGSLLKGTTKYIAPELVSNQFGPRGPASDLYSLGFAAYELMCGRHFESLFPGLSAFGPDPQIAWLMWHAAPDRHLPRIAQVLEGVPEELAEIIERLAAKDQGQRFHTAAEALGRLAARSAATAIPPPPPPRDLEADAAREQEARKKRTMRIAAIAAMAGSLVISTLMLLPSRPQPSVDEGLKPMQGIVRSIHPNERMVVIERLDNGRPQEVPIKSRDEVVINDRKEVILNLQPGDRATVEYLRDGSGRTITRIVATRPKSDSGRIEAIEADEGKLTIARADGGPPLVVRVPSDLEILFNGKPSLDGQPVTLAALQAGDRVVVDHTEKESGHEATRLAVERIVTLEGVLRELNEAQRRITVARGEGTSAELVAMPLGEQVDVTINHRNDLDGRLVRVRDLQPGDRVTLSHDVRVVRIDAVRVLGQAGTIAAINVGVNALDFIPEGSTRPSTVLAPPETEITLAGQKVALADLRIGDLVDVRHAPGADTPKALSIAATRPSDPSRWAVLVAIEDYDDQSLSKLEYPIEDATLLQQMLVDRYRVPAAQAILLTDVSQVRLEQGVPAALERTKPEDKVVLYYSGHAYRGSDGEIWLAPKSFNLARIDASGVKLRWLVEQFEKCPARDKLLLLDTSHAGTGEDLKSQPSAGEMLASLQTQPGRSPLRSLTAIASSSEGQRGQPWPEKQHGLFAYALAQGLSGQADTNRDGRIENTELFSYLNETMPSLSAGWGQPQTPALFLPDATPPRLTEEAKTAVRRLVAYLGQSEIDVLDVKLEYTNTEKLAPTEPEPRLAYGLVLLKARERNEATSVLQKLSAEHPALLLPIQALAWIEFEKRSYAAGARHLVRLIDQIPAPQAAAGYSPAELNLFEWVGRLREFAGTAVDPSYRPAGLDEIDRTVAKHAAAAAQRYQGGRAETARRLARFDERAASGDAADQSLARVQRQQVIQFAEFPFGPAGQEILDRLEK